MTELEFVSHYRLRTGDRLIREKGPFSKHHGILVKKNGRFLIAENQNGLGVHYTTISSFLLGDINNLVKIIPFPRSESERGFVVNHVDSLLGTPYNFFTFNCEHFAELIQNGSSKSKQVNNGIWFGVLAFLAIAAIASSSEDKPKKGRRRS